MKRLSNQLIILQIMIPDPDPIREKNKPGSDPREKTGSGSNPLEKKRIQIRS